MQNNFQKVLYYYGLIGENSSTKVKVTCPFHEDDRPSMLVDLESGRFYCFGCQVKGDEIDFIQQVEKCTRLEALQKLSHIISNPTFDQLKLFKQPEKTSKEWLKEAKLYFYTLPKPKWNRLTPAARYMKERGFKKQTLIENGLRENFNVPYSVIAPVLDQGDFKGYVCRAIYDCDRKYLYNKGFRRSTMLCGNYYKPWVVITEGYMDYLKLKQAGLKNCVAIFGWKATDYQISKLQTVTDSVISALDQTDTGEMGSRYLSEYFKVKRFRFPSGAKDVGDLDKWSMNKALADTFNNLKEDKIYG